MKKSFGITLLTLLFLSVGCDPVTTSVGSFENTGEILGLDAAQCACCGGHVITVDGMETDFRVTEFPSNFQTTLEELEFPVDVRFDYTILNDCSSLRLINVTSIQVVE